MQGKRVLEEDCLIGCCVVCMCIRAKVKEQKMSKGQRENRGRAGERSAWQGRPAAGPREPRNTACFLSADSSR